MLLSALATRRSALLLSCVLLLACAAPATAGCGAACKCGHPHETVDACGPDLRGPNDANTSLAHGVASFLRQRGYAYVYPGHQSYPERGDALAPALCRYHHTSPIQALSGAVPAPHRMGRITIPASPAVIDGARADNRLFSKATDLYSPSHRSPALPLYLRHLSLLI